MCTCTKHYLMKRDIKFLNKERGANGKTMTETCSLIKYCPKIMDELTPLRINLLFTAWFLKIRWSSQRRFTEKVPGAVMLIPDVLPSAAARLSNGFAVAIRASHSASVASAPACSTRAFCLFRRPLALDPLEFPKQFRGLIPFVILVFVIIVTSALAHPSWRLTVAIRLRAILVPILVVIRILIHLRCVV